MRRGRNGFTLIELLIVVAIIALLALIAVPNFLEAQTRAKVSRAKADMRSIATGIEAYAVDVSDYPRNFSDATPRNWTLSPDLTTPVAYLTTADYPDPFSLYKENDPLVKAIYYSYHRILREQEIDPPWNPGFPEEFKPPYESRDGPSYNQGALLKFGQWRTMSLGPDRDYLPPNYMELWNQNPQLVYDLIDTPYDPTNGTISWGSILRTQLHPEGQIPAIHP